MPLRRRVAAAASGELAELRARLAEAEETLRAIRGGEVDAVVVAGREGPQVFTLKDSGLAYRTLIESMNEGALILGPGKLILYANQCFARMVKCPLEQVTGGSLRRFLSAEDRAALRSLLRHNRGSGAKLRVLLRAGDGSQMPVQISLAKPGGDGASVGVVVTDLTESRRNEELLRSLTHRVVQAQEDERAGVALLLHDHITQLLCAILVRIQALANNLTACESGLKREAIQLRQLLGGAAEEVERISRDLRPGVLSELGLVAALRAAARGFAERTGVSTRLALVPLAARLPAEIELALYRIFQEALRHVEKHARARRVTVRLTRPPGRVQLTIQDDGSGFNPEQHLSGAQGHSGLGLLSMRERAFHVGGELKIKSTRRLGTAIKVRVPLPPGRTGDPSG